MHRAQPVKKLIRVTKNVEGVRYTNFLEILLTVSLYMDRMQGWIICLTIAV